MLRNGSFLVQFLKIAIETTVFPPINCLIIFLKMESGNCCNTIYAP